MSSNKKKYSNLLLELKYLYAKIDYQQEAFEDAKEEFKQFAIEFCEDRGIDIEDDIAATYSDVTALDIRRDNICNFSDLNCDQENKYIKLLFKKIATKTHPDKFAKAGKEEKKRKTKLFLKAREAADANQWFILLEIAKELDIKLPKLDDEQCDLLDQELKNAKISIKDIEDTYAWIFFNEKNEIRRQLLLISYLKNFGIDLTKDIN